MLSKLLLIVISIIFFKLRDVALGYPIANETTLSLNESLEEIKTSTSTIVISTSNIQTSYKNSTEKQAYFNESILIKDQIIESNEQDITTTNISPSESTVSLDLASKLNETMSTIVIFDDPIVTKVPDQEDNPEFIKCVNSCGSDHDCVRTKCLNDSTYFG